MKKLSVVVLSVCLSACADRYASNGERLYLQSKNGPTLQVPPPLTNANVSYFYDLPAQNQNALVSIEPPIPKRGS